MQEEKTPRWAKIDENGVVVQTIIASRARVQSGKEGNPDDWMEYTDGKGDGMRGPCGIGMTYSTDLDQFIMDPPYPSWILNTNTMEWEPPVEKPQDTFQVLGGPIGIQTTYKLYDWDENTTSWQVTLQSLVPTGDNDTGSDNYIAPTRTQAEAEADGG